MKKLILKLFLLAAPLFIILILFLVFDPFRIIKKYDDYSKNMIVVPNRDYVSSQMFLRNRHKYNYDSFIFGSSRTLAFKMNTWRQYLPATASPFAFDASGESIFGIYTKIKYLDETGSRLNNALVILCQDVTFIREADHKGHLLIKHPEIAHTSWLNFYLTFIRDFLDFNFLKSYFTFLATKEFNSSMSGYIENRILKYDTITNEQSIVSQDSELRRNPAEYYLKRGNIFYNRDSISHYGPKQITTRKQLSMLGDIVRIFKKHNTKYRVVISPLYNQIKFNTEDLTVVKNIFGAKNVFDFSGKNYFTRVKENYYESSHYLPFIGDSILKVIYMTN